MLLYEIQNAGDFEIARNRRSKSKDKSKTQKMAKILKLQFTNNTEQKKHAKCTGSIITVMGVVFSVIYMFFITIVNSTRQEIWALVLQVNPMREQFCGS